MPLVSVIIPAYNRASFVTEAIDSVLTQTFKDFEIIVIDDGSTDNTKEVLRKKYGNQIQYIYQENKGPSSARNTGIKASTGKYIAFLDSDDLWLPKKLTRQMGLFERLPSKVGLVYCSAYRQEIGDSNIILATHRGNILKQLLLETDMPIKGTPGVAIRRGCLENVGLFDESLQRSVDRDLWIRISKYYHVDFVKDPLTIIRRVDKSVMQDVKRLDNMFAVLDKVFDDPTCPQDIKELRNKAYASRAIGFMWGYYNNNRVVKVWTCFLRALYYNPTSIKLKHLNLFLKAPLRPFFR